MFDVAPYNSVLAALSFLLLSLLDIDFFLSVANSLFFHCPTGLAAYILHCSYYIVTLLCLVINTPFLNHQYHLSRKIYPTPAWTGPLSFDSKHLLDK